MANGIFGGYLTETYKQVMNRLRHTLKFGDMFEAINARTVKTVAVAVTGASTNVNVGEAIETLYGVDVFVSGVQDTGVTAAIASSTVEGQVDFTGVPSGAGYAIVKYD